MVQELGLLVAFVGGLLSFFSPCVLPLIPGYLANISGTSLKELSGSAPRGLQSKIFFNSIAFTLAFSVIFILLGLVIAGVFGFVGPSFQGVLNRVGGTLIILFGIHTTGLYEIPIFNRALKIPTRRATKTGKSDGSKGGSGPINSFMVGAAFGVGWTPCFGPILASILVLAGTSGSVAAGGSLLAIYSLGLGIPFLVTGIFTQQASGLISRNRKMFNTVTQLSGIILIALGILVFTDSFVRLLALLPAGAAALFPG